MTEKMFAFVIGLAVAMFAIPANANWQFTQWGMTLTQVMAASGGKIVPIPGNTRCSKLSSLYQANGVTFDRVAFCFDNNALVSVMLQSRTTSFAELDQMLSSILGPSLTSQPGYVPTEMFNDRAHGNMVRLQNLGPDGASITYLPLPTTF